MKNICTPRRPDTHTHARRALGHRPLGHELRVYNNTSPQLPIATQIFPNLRALSRQPMFVSARPTQYRKMCGTFFLRSPALAIDALPQQA